MSTEIARGITVEDVHVRGNRRLGAQDYDVFMEVMRKYRPQVVVEIGAADGCASMTLGLLAREYGGKVYSVEPYPTAKWVRNIKDLGLEDTVTPIAGASPFIGRDVIPHQIDFLQIDGDHRTKAIILDYAYWEPRVAIGGLIGFHDYCGSKGTYVWVRRAIDIILEDDTLTEVARSEARSYGEIVFEKRRNPAPCPQWPGKPLVWKAKPSGR